MNPDAADGEESSRYKNWYRKTDTWKPPSRGMKTLDKKKLDHIEQEAEAGASFLGVHLFTAEKQINLGTPSKSWRGYLWLPVG
jgi:hypothetical protein